MSSLEGSIPVACSSERAACERSAKVLAARRRYRLKTWRGLSLALERCMTLHDRYVEFPTVVMLRRLRRYFLRITELLLGSMTKEFLKELQ